MKKIILSLFNKIKPSNFTLMVLLFFIFQLKSIAQISAYSFSESLETYSEISGGTVAYASPWDNHVAGAAVSANFGFNFEYNSSVFTSCFISPNGFITFGAVQPANNNYAPLSNASAYNGAVSALGTDLISNTDAITYNTIGTAPNRVFVVQWKNAVRKLETGVFNFQIRLYETSNEIELRYGFCFPDNTTVITAQVGLRGPNNTFLSNVNNRLQAGVNINNVWFLKTTLGTANSSTVRTSQAEYPDNGLVYRYSVPPACTTPTGSPSSLVIGGTSVTTTAFTGNSFTPTTPSSVRYLVLRSTINTPPDATLIPNGTYWGAGNIIGGTYNVISTSNASNFVQTGLTNNTTYYYWVIPYDGDCLGGPLYNFTNMISGSQTTCIPATTLLATSAINGNGFTINFNAVPGATNYQIDVSTNNTFTAILPAYNNVLTGGSTSFTVTDLPPLTTYYFRVRAVGLGCNINSSTGIVALPCGYYFVPYNQNFDTTAVNAIPNCTATVDDNTDGTSWRVQAINPASAPRALYLNKNTTVAMDDWFFLPGLKLDGGTAYRLFFRYNSTATGGLSERLRVRLGNGQSVAQMSITILDLPNITNTIYQSAFVDFTPVTNGVYYLGFQGYSAANQSYLVLDDISVTVAPTCFEPENLNLTAVGTTTATIGFDVPSTEPSQGYQYYLSTSDVAPTVATVPTGSVPFGSNAISLSGLTSSTSYYIWVRGNCGGTDVSIWTFIFAFSTECNPPVFTTVTPANRCGNGTVNLVAIPNSGSVTQWYDAAVGGNLLFTGSTFTTPSLTANTTYYAQAKAAGGNVSAGPRTPNAIAGNKALVTTPSAVFISITEETQLLGVDIFPLSSGQSGLMVIRNALNVAVASIPFTTSVVGGNTPQTIPVNYNFTPGNYSVSLTTVPTSGLIGNADNIAYPYTSSVASITGNNFDNSFFIFFYNWRFTTTCLSAMTPVTATITPPPSLNLSASSAVICSGESTAVVNVIGAGSFNTFTWSPATGVSGSVGTGYTFNPTETTIYTLTASQTSGAFCSANTTITVTVNPSPPAITILPGDVTICEGTILPLTATFGASAAVNIVNENFEGASGWTVTNTSVGGNVANAAWTLRNSTYSYTSGTWTFNASSNDASQFYMANSDAQGSPSSNLTRTTLESPTFSLDGYSSAGINFWHYLRWITGNKAHVEISIDNGATWTLVGAYTGIQGGASNFVNRIIDISPYVGNSFVKIRFLFEATWDYGWAIDNVRVFGVVATAVNWSPITDLYTDAAATIPYTGTPTSSVFAKPTVTRTYDAIVTTIDGCDSQSSVTITVDAQPIAGTLNGNQTLCAGSAVANLDLVGSSGPIIRWEYADDLAFTVNVTPIAFTGTSLSSVEMGVFSNTRYFRAVLANGVCPIVYSNVAAVEYPTTIWNGSTWSNGLPDATKRAIFMGNYTSTGNVTACSLEVQSGNVTIQSGHALIITNNVNVTGPVATTSLVFQNDASLIQINDVVNTGNIQYYREANPMIRNDYSYWSSPVANQVLNVFSPLTNPNRYYIFDNTIYNWLSVPGASTMVQGRGYIIRAPSNYSTTVPTVFNGLFSGVPNNGNVDSAVVVNGLGNRNLLGNPYPSAIHADLLADAYPTILQGSFYFWTHNTPITNNVYTENDYAVYNQTGGTAAAINSGINNGIPTGYIAAGQGFFVQGLSSGTITFANTMRVIGNNADFFRPDGNKIEESTISKNRIWLNLTNAAGAFKQQLVGYIQGATNAVDNRFDADAVEAGNSVNFYSIVNNTKLSIQGRSLPFLPTDTVPLGFRVTQEGNYQISIAQFDGLFANGQQIYLEDTLLQITHNLSNSSYAFSTASGSFEDRFILKFEEGSLSINDPQASIFQVIKFDRTIQVQSSALNQLNEVKLFDLNGRLLATKSNILQASVTFENLSFANQVILVQSKLENGSIVTRKVVF